VIDSCSDLERATLVHARIEETAFGSESFDIVHSCHTLEHVAQPVSVLADHWRTLKPGGLLAVDVPNLAFLGSDDVVEEWFIDKHLYHFSVRTLTRVVENTGFQIVQAPDHSDRDNILVVARKAGRRASSIDADPAEVDRAEKLIQTYVATRARNLMTLTAMATDIMSMRGRGVAMWGAGRIFDSLVVHGHFDPKALKLLIDKNLRAHVPERYGCALQPPEALRQSGVGVVVIMSRAFAQEIADEARRLAPQADVLFYSDMLARAQRQTA